jgi:antitoxin (DNA-binding transcriptional repressor) of toxin-antitoxin stability system
LTNVKQINIFEAKTHLSAHIQAALNGEEVIIAKAGKPLVRLQPLEKPKRKLGGWRDKVKMAPDFDECTPEIEKLFGIDSPEK